MGSVQKGYFLLPNHSDLACNYKLVFPFKYPSNTREKMKYQMNCHQGLPKTISLL